MNEHIQELLPAYSLGSLDPEEHELVIRHLAVCEHCRQELDSFRTVTEKLAYATVPIDPPASLRQAVLDRVQADLPQELRSARSTPFGDWLSELFSWKTAAALAVILLAASNLFLWRQVSVLRGTETVFQTVALSGSEEYPLSSAVLIISQDGKYGTLVVDDLPVLDETQIYQLWLIDKNGNRTSGGIFDVSRSGYGSMEIWSEEPLDSFPAFGVTIEPLGGSPQPTGERVLGGEL